MPSWSSYKEQKLLSEGWKAYLKGDLYSSKRVDEIFGMGKKQSQVRGTVYNNVLAEVTTWMGQTIQEMRKDPETSEEVRAIVQEIDEVAIIDEFEEMITGQQFELLEQSAFRRDDQDGGVAQTGHVADPEAEEGEDPPLTFEPDGHENITKFIEVIKDNPEHVEKFVTELKRSGFSNCVDTLGCKKPAVEPGTTGLVRKFRGASRGLDVDTGLKGTGEIDPKKKTPVKVPTAAGAALVLHQNGELVVATDTDDDGKIDAVKPSIEKILDLLRQLCAFEVYPEDQRDSALAELEQAVRPELEAAGTEELSQLIRELEAEIAAQGECEVPAQIGADPDAAQIGADTAPGQIGGPEDMKQLQGPDEILINYGGSLKRALAMARTGGIENFSKDDFDLIYMAMSDCNDESNVRFEDPAESSNVSEAVDYDGDKCNDLRDLGASPQFISLVAKAISEDTDGIEYKKFFLNLPGAEIEGGGQGKGGGDDTGGDDGTGGDDAPGAGEKKEYYVDDSYSTSSIKSSWKSNNRNKAGRSFEGDLQAFVDFIGPFVPERLLKAKAAQEQEISEKQTIKSEKHAIRKLSNTAYLKGSAQKIIQAFKKLATSNRKGAQAVERMATTLETGGAKREFDKFIQKIRVRTVPDEAEAGQEQEAQPRQQEPKMQQAAEGLLKESEVHRWQRLAGIKKRVL